MLVGSLSGKWEIAELKNRYILNFYFTPYSENGSELPQKKVTKMPLGEIVFDFYDKLKTISRGYASFDYFPLEFRQSNLAKLDILLNGDQVDALSALIHRDNAYTLGKKICLKLKELIPRQQFDIAIQSAFWLQF